MERKKVGRVEGWVEIVEQKVKVIGGESRGETGTANCELRTRDPTGNDAPYTEELASCGPKGNICTRKMMYSSFGEHGVVFHLRFA